jgi:hypothetical protein
MAANRGVYGLPPGPTAAVAQIPVTFKGVGFYKAPLGTSTATINSYQTQQHLAPMFFDRTCTIDRIGIEVTTGSAATTVRLGIYSPDPNSGLPRRLLLDAGTVDSSSTGFKEIVVNLDIPVGLVWVTCGVSGAGPAVRAQQGLGTGHCPAQATMSSALFNGLATTAYASGVPFPIELQPSQFINGNVETPRVLVRIA